MLNLHLDLTTRGVTFLHFLSEFHLCFEINPFSQNYYRPNAINSGKFQSLPFVTIYVGKYLYFRSVGSANWKQAFFTAW